MVIWVYKTTTGRTPPLLLFLNSSGNFLTIIYWIRSFFFSSLVRLFDSLIRSSKWGHPSKLKERSGGPGFRLKQPALLHWTLHKPFKKAKRETKRTFLRDAFSVRKRRIEGDYGQVSPRERFRSAIIARSSSSSSQRALSPLSAREWIKHAGVQRNMDGTGNFFRHRVS